MVILSPSSLSDIESCGWQYYYRKIQGIKPPTKVHFIKGRNFHKAAEENFRQKIGSKKDLSANDLKDYIATAGLWETPAEGIYSPKKDVQKALGKAKDEVINLMPALAEESKPISPALVEWMPEKPLCLDGEKGIYLTFRLDLMTEDGWLPDLKTGMVTQEKADCNYGLTAASFAAEIEFGGLLKPRRWTLEQFKKTEEGYHRRFETTRGEEDYLKLKATADAAAKIIQAEAWLPPAPMMAWMCRDCWFRGLPCKGRLY